jgi:pyridoxine/pyridoxamine 5'-phosphate oxidase
MVYGELMKRSLLLVAGVLTSVVFAAANENEPETVLVRYHVKAGKSDELAQLIDRTWATYQRLGMVLQRPHLVMKGNEDGGVFMAEVLPWKSHSMPDNAPAEVQALWDKMQALCEKRGDRDSIEIPEVEVLRNDF